MMILMSMMLLFTLMLCFAIGLIEIEDEFWLDDAFDDDSIPWSEIEEEMREQVTALGNAFMGLFASMDRVEESLQSIRDDIEIGDIHSSSYGVSHSNEGLVDGEDASNTTTAHLESYGTMP